MCCPCKYLRFVITDNSFILDTIIQKECIALNTSKEIINISLIQEGNHLEFARLMDIYTDALFLFAKGILANSQLAEEVVSDVFIKVWESRDKLSVIADLKSYLYSAVHNQAISSLRKENKNIVSIEDIDHFHFEPADTPDDGLIQEEQLRKIYKAVNRLPAQTKMVFSLAKVQGLKYKEIAKVLGISVKTVDYHVASAVKKICESLDKEDNDNLHLLKIFLMTLSGG